MGISVQNSRRNYTPPESPVLQLSHLPTSSLSEEGGFSRKWELSTPSSTQPSQSSSLPLLGLVLLPKAPFPLPGVLLHWAMLCCQKDSVDSVWSEPLSQCIHASCRAAFGHCQRIEWTFHRADVIQRKINLELLVSSAGRRYLPPWTPAPQEPCRANSTWNPYWTQ